MKQSNTRNQPKTQKNKAKIMLIVALIILAIIQIILLLNKKKNIGENKQQSLLGMEVSIANTNFDITNQVAETPNAPVLSAGMIPIKYNGSNWVVTTTSDTSWYDYKNKKPAYIMLNDGTYSSEIMENKIVATSGTILQTNTMGTVFAWVPRFAYYSLNPRHDIIYLKEKSSIAGDYVTPDLFTCAGSGIKAQDIALEGIWVEQNGTLSSSKITSFNSETNTYGFIGNIKALEKKLDTDLVTAISQMDENLIKNTSNSRAIIQVIDERVLEPIMATVTIKGTTITVEVQKAEYGIDRVLVLNKGNLVELTETREGSNKYTMKATETGTYKIMVIDKQGNQKGCETNITVPKIEVITNQNNFVEYNNQKWYPEGTQVKLTYAESITGITPYYKQITGTTDTEEWVKSSITTTTLTLEETTKIKIKIENAGHDTENEIEETIYIMPSDVRSLATSYRNNIGETYPVQITTNTLVTQTLEGTGTYSYDTAIRQSATHIGLTDKIVYIKIVPSPQGGYIGSTRNGITTNNGTTNKNGYIFITENGQEIKLPQINKIEKTVEENKIKVQIDAKSYMGNIEKYYYSIDNGNYTETESNTHEFEAEPYTNHTIKVYVKDSFGLVSQVQSTSSKTGNTLPTPTIEIVDKDNIQTVEYNGKTWYPYGTQVQITYAETMTNLVGYYNPKNITTGEEEWLTTSMSSIKITLTESMSIYAKIQDSTGAESDVENMENIYIMPGTTLQENYANYTLGEIYPVKVTKNTTGPIYGTDTYTYTTNIGTALSHIGYKQDGEIYYIKVVEGPSKGYKVTTKNGITSEYSESKRGYVFVTEDGLEIKCPQITSISAIPGKNSTLVTVGDVVFFGTELDKYYYKIDDGEFVENTVNHVEYADILAYQDHVVQVYVTSKNGTASETVTISSRPTNEMPTPKMEIVDKATIETVQYDEKTWYPYDTKIKMSYDITGIREEDKANLSICYKTKNLTTSAESDWIELTTTELEIPLTESMNYYMKVQDKTREETAEVSIGDTYIMPGDTLQQSYANKLGSIYPVKATYKTSGTIYGLSVYHYNSNISRAAMHMGLIETEGQPRTLYIKVSKPNEAYYKSYTNHEITSSELKQSDNGFMFVNADGEELAPLPKVNSVTITQGTSTKTVTASATATAEGATISTYYYIVNGTTYSSTSNTYTISNSSALNMVSVQVYVIDSNENISLKSSAKTSGSASGSVTPSSVYQGTTGTTSTSAGYICNFAISGSSIRAYRDGSTGATNETTIRNNCDKYNRAILKIDLSHIPSDQNVYITFSGRIENTQNSSKSVAVYIYDSTSYYNIFYSKSVQKDTTESWSGTDYVKGGKTYTFYFILSGPHGGSYWVNAYIDNIEIKCDTPSLSITAPTGGRTINGETWYPYGSTLKFTAGASATYKATQTNKLTNEATTYTLSSNTTTSKTVYESSVWTAEGTSGSMSTGQKEINVNVMPNASGMNSNQKNYYADAYLGRIYPVYVTGTTSRYSVWLIYI